MELSGTLYAPRITNDAANVEESESGTRTSSAAINLEIGWLPFGHASKVKSQKQRYRAL